jgi:hypothetical protein
MAPAGPLCATIMLNSRENAMANNPRRATQALATQLVGSTSSMNNRPRRLRHPVTGEWLANRASLVEEPLWTKDRAQAALFLPGPAQRQRDVLEQHWGVESEEDC